MIHCWYLPVFTGDDPATISSSGTEDESSDDNLKSEWYNNAVRQYDITDSDIH